MSRTHSRRPARLFGLMTLAALLVASVFTLSAQADTTFPPGTGDFIVTATVNGDTYTYPAGGPGPTIPDVVDGDNVTIAVTDAPGGASVFFSRLRARQCAPDRGVSNNTEFNPQIFNRCSSARLGTGSLAAFVDSGPVPPGTSSLTVNFVVGEGTAPDVVSQFDGETYPGFGCGPGAPCKIVVNAEVTTAPGSSNYLAFPISFQEDEPTSDLVVMECDNVSGLTAVKLPLDNTLQPNVALALKINKPTDFPGQYPRSCTGAKAAEAGPLTKVAAKFVGSMSCSASAGGAAVLPNGKMTFTWTNVDPVKLKPLQSATYVRLDQSQDMVDGISIANGIVTKGVGIGSDVEGSFLHQPTLKNGPAAQSALAADGELIPGPGSSTLAAGCASGANTIAAGLWSTDGTTLTGTPFDSSIKFTLPA